MAAVCSCGPDAALSHRVRRTPVGAAPLRARSFSHVTVPGCNGRRKRPGVRLHHSVTLTRHDVTRRHSIPVTTLTRGPPAISVESTGRTRSDLGTATSSSLHASTRGLPLPEVNARVGPYEVDFLWRAERLVVELDGYAYALPPRRLVVADRRRDRRLQAMGFTVLRFADDDVDVAPEVLGVPPRRAA